MAPGELLKSWPIDAATSLDVALILYLLGREVLATREIAGPAGLFRLHHNYRPKTAFLKGRGASIGRAIDGDGDGAGPLGDLAETQKTPGVIHRGCC